MPSYGTFSYGGGEYGGPPVFTQTGLETAGGLFPQRIVEVAFGNGPNDTSPTWVDITSDVTEIQTNRGRQHTLGRFEAGTMKVTVDNKSGKYSPFNSSGPYYNQIRPGMPIRFRAAWGANIYTVYYGFVESWPLVWPAANDSTVAVSAVDAMKFLNLKRPTSINFYPGVILADAPVAWWRCNDAVGSTTPADASGHGNTGFRASTNPATTSTAGTWQFQSEPLLTADTSPSLFLGYHEVEFGGPLGLSFSATSYFSFEAWVNLSSSDQAYFVEAQTSATNEFALMFDGSNLLWSSPVAGPLVITGPSMSTNQTYHIVGTCTGTTNAIITLFVNGNQVGQTSNTFVGWSGSFSSVRIGGRFGTVFDEAIGNGYIQEVAVYNYVLTPTQVRNHYNAGVAPRQLETTGQRIAALASYTGIPAAQQKIDTGNTVVQGATDNWLKDTILKSMQDQADTENGDLFIDAAGNLCFFDRYHTSHSPYSSVTIVLGDSGAPPEEPYRLGGTSVPYDDQDVWNEVVVTPAGLAAQIASDATSQQQYGKRTQSISTLSASVADAIGRASWELNLNKASVPRVDSIVVVPTDDPTMLFGPVLGSDVLSRVELRRRPMDGTASLFDQTALIEGIEHKVGKATWETTWRLSTVDAVIAGIFNESNFNQAVFAY